MSAWCTSLYSTSVEYGPLWYAVQIMTKIFHPSKPRSRVENYTVQQCLSRTRLLQLYNALHGFLCESLHTCDIFYSSQHSEQYCCTSFFYFSSEQYCYTRFSRPKQFSSITGTVYTSIFTFSLIKSLSIHIFYILLRQQF